jgi:hypothetical protein
VAPDSGELADPFTVPWQPEFDPVSAISIVSHSSLSSDAPPHALDGPSSGSSESDTVPTLDEASGACPGLEELPSNDSELAFESAFPGYRAVDLSGETDVPHLIAEPESELADANMDGPAISPAPRDLRDSDADYVATTDMTIHDETDADTALGVPFSIPPPPVDPGPTFSFPNQGLLPPDDLDVQDLILDTDMVGCLLL